MLAFTNTQFKILTAESQIFLIAVPTPFQAICKSQNEANDGNAGNQGENARNQGGNANKRGGWGWLNLATSILANLSTWCSEHSVNISCSLLVNPSQTDESWEGQNIYIYMFIYMNEKPV